MQLRYAFAVAIETANYGSELNKYGNESPLQDSIKDCIMKVM